MSTGSDLKPHTKKILVGFLAKACLYLIIFTIGLISLQEFFLKLWMNQYLHSGRLIIYILTSEKKKKRSTVKKPQHLYVDLHS